MEKADFAPFSQMLALTAEQYGKAMSPELTRFYFEGLATMSLQEVRAALTAHVRNTDIGQFMPKIADLIRVVEGNSEAAAYAALALVNAGFNGSGRTGELDPIALAVVRDMGGMRAIGMRQTDEWQNFGSKEFVKRYRSYKARNDANAPGYLPGYLEPPKLESK
jgi:hypothetical protein